MIQFTHLTQRLFSIKFCRYLIVQFEKHYLLQVFNFAIWWLQNISWIFNFAISIKIREKSLIQHYFFIVSQCNCYHICYRNSNFVTVSRDMLYTDISVSILWSNISKKRISNRYFILQVFNFVILLFWNFLLVQNFAKMDKRCKDHEI